ncbi:MAG: tautomerase family protein [Alphaproteobacteria bacterium]|nr:tautomerase family protein [Alphaproteobacteria bacterium]
MPWVVVNMLEGLSDKRKLAIHQSVAKAISDVLEISIDLVQVQLIEMKPEDYSKGGIRGKPRRTLN